MRVFSLALLTAFALATAATADQPRRPNIVLIMADDMGYECVGANGGTSYRTPALDKLAANGMRFEHCHAQPLCTPSRVQLMTGIYNQRNYLRFGLLDPKATTFAHLLKQAGYATGVVGKWQLGGGLDAPAQFGFDEYCLWQLTVRESRYPNPLIEENGKIIQYRNGEYGPDVVCDYLCSSMERNKDRRFFAYYPLMLPHAPFVPTPDSPQYDPKATDEEAGADKKHFADMVAYTDKLVGKVVDKLHDLGVAENTLVLFTGDNGTGRAIVSRMGDREIHGGKGLTTDAGTHVPLIASWPGTIPAGQVCRDLVDFSDFLPTMLEAAGAPPPKGIDGRSFLPQLLGQPGQPSEWIYCWYSRDGGPTGIEFTRNQRFKLYRDGPFYDVQADPLEQTPLAEDARSPEARQAHAVLRAALTPFEGTRPTIAPKAGKHEATRGSLPSAR